MGKGKVRFGLFGGDRIVHKTDNILERAAHTFSPERARSCVISAESWERSTSLTPWRGRIAVGEAFALEQGTPPAVADAATKGVVMKSGVTPPQRDLGFPFSGQQQPCASQ